MRRIAALVCAGFCAAASVPVHADQRVNEQYLLDVPSASRALQDATRLNQESHYAGTPGDQHIAQWMRDQLASDGFDASLESFQAPVPFLRQAQLSLMTKPRVDFDLREAPIASDPDGSRKGAGIPFNAFSGNGAVEAPVVDAGAGLDDDYARLAKSGIDVHKRIVLVRYGAEFRGLLARRAQQSGAAGVIFYTSPAAREGSLNGPAYPDGPYRPTGSVQRGSLGQPRLSIPVLPVSADVAARITSAMRNSVTQVPVRLRVDETIDRATLWNTVGELRGEDPTHMIVLGAHRDAWVYGVTDNGAGVTTLLEAARALGYMYRSGWRPQFSIVIAGFDGEEIGEAGSEAYVRAHEGPLRSGCIAYINEDENATGQIFTATASAPLEAILPSAAKRIRNPGMERDTIYQRWEAQPGGARISGPAGGSDFEAFLYELGIPMVEVAFHGPFGVYHSAFDDLNYATTQADPGFVNHTALAQMVALLAYRLSSGTVPYQLGAFAPRMRAELAVIGAGHSADIAPLANAVNRFAYATSQLDRHAIDGNLEIGVTHRLDLLFYGRNGYAPVAFPQVSAALASGNEAAISAAVGATVHALDDISRQIANSR